VSDFIYSDLVHRPVANPVILDPME